MRRLVVAGAAALAIAVAPGCAGQRTVLEDTASSLDEIRSGELAFELAVKPEGDGEPFSIELAGPFSFPEDGGVASADLTYRQTLGAESEEIRVFSEGREGWFEVDGERRPLTQEQLDALAVGGEDDDEFLASLELDEWFIEQETEDGPGDTVVIRGRAHAGRALEGLMRLSGGLGEEGRFELTEEDERDLERAVRDSILEVVTGADDHLLRRLRYDLELGFDLPAGIKEALGGLDGAVLAFDLEIRSPNEPVEIG